MKKISLLIITSVLVSSGFAQQFPLQSQYQFNYPTINPAANGENDFYRARVSFRNQWGGLTDNPITTQIMTVTKRFDNDGLGGTVFSDKTGGYFNSSGASLSYSRRVKFGKGSDLFFGISAGSAKYNVVISEEAVDEKDEIFTAAFGIYYVYNDFRFGISVPGLTNSNIDIGTGSDQNTIDKHVYTMCSYERKINEDWSVYPSFLVKTTANHNQIDLNINCKVKNTLWFGASYRTSASEEGGTFGPSVYMGIDLARVLAVYSMDFSAGPIADNSNGTHEITLGYDFISDEDLIQEVSDNGLSDQDKDGVQDEDDICPTEYGDPNANGCPDFDKDGVPDKFDLCPHLFGNIEAQGCPKLTVGEKVILSDALADFNFRQGQYEIEYESYGTLSKVVVLMHTNPNMYLLIEGFASSEGTESYNLSLSAKRAKAVQNFFIERGIERTRLVMDFYGEDSPLNSNFTEQERAENRRVEFDIRYHLQNLNTANNLKNEYNVLLAKLNGEKSNPIIDDRKRKSLIEVINNAIQKDVVVESESIEEDVVVEPEEAVVVETVLPEAIEEDVVIETILPDAIKEDVVVEDNTATVGDINRYLVIVQVFNDLSNAMEFTYGKVLDLQYIYLNEKYYVYAFASKQRSDAEKFRAEYQKECWILDPK